MSLTTSAHSLRSFALTARSTGLSALRAIEHYRGRVLNHGRACQRCDVRTKGFCSALLRCGEIKLIAEKRESEYAISDLNPYHEYRENEAAPNKILWYAI